jgi:hypothetical protein
MEQAGEVSLEPAANLAAQALNFAVFPRTHPTAHHQHPQWGDDQRCERQDEPRAEVQDPWPDADRHGVEIRTQGVEKLKGRRAQRARVIADRGV